MVRGPTAETPATARVGATFRDRATARASSALYTLWAPGIRSETGWPIHEKAYVPSARWRASKGRRSASARSDQPLTATAGWILRASRASSGGSSPTRAAPFASTARSRSSFSVSTPERSSRRSTWVSETVVTTPTVGRATRASSAISPGSLVPISRTSEVARSGIDRMVSGVPMRLLLFADVPCAHGVDASAPSVRSFTVVLPDDPVMPTTGIRACSRRCSARSPSAVSVSVTR